MFTGIGLFPGQPYHIEVDESIPPVQHPPRQVPVHLQPAYKRELERLTDLGIITEVQNEFTPWVNSVVVTPKADGSIRLCLDPRDLNRAVKRNAYYARTVDDVIPQVSGSTVTGKSLLTKKAVDSALSALLGESSGGINSHLG